MKTTTRRCSDLLPKRVIDDAAETLEELRMASMMGRDALYVFVNRELAAGRWEQVWKKGKGGGLVRAYRVKQ